MARIPRGDGYSLLWRMGWRFEYVLMHVYGPATLDDARDPKHQMRQDRARRQALHRQRQAEKRRAAAPAQR
ncbi:MAG: hypothetical protein ABWX96_15915 [Propionibacteriaceae bacterium]